MAENVQIIPEKPMWERRLCRPRIAWETDSDCIPLPSPNAKSRPPSSKARGWRFPAHIIGPGVRIALLRASLRYEVPGKVETPPLWHRVCDGGECEFYSNGDGFCMMQACDLPKARRLQLLPEDELARMEANRAEVQMVTNCKVQNLGTDAQSEDRPSEQVSGTSLHAQLFHCPKEVPIAVFPVPKCGTTSIVNWVLSMEGRRERASLASGARLLFREGKWAANPFVESFIYPELRLAMWSGAVSPGNDSSFVVGVTQLKRTVHQFKELVTGTSIKDLQQRFLPPAHLCPTCCIYGLGRQRVVVVRNPFVRIVSLFRMMHLNADYPRVTWTRWMDFSPWLGMLVQMRQEAPDGCSDEPSRGLPSCEPFRQLDTSDESGLNALYFHCRPVADMVNDRRFPLGGEFLARGWGTHVIHLETLRRDIAMLEHHLCSRLEFCEPLPRFQKVLPNADALSARQLKERCQFNARTKEWSNCTAPPWEDFWTPQLIDTMVRTYGEDFRLLGYSRDPAHLMPLWYT